MPRQTPLIAAESIENTLTLHRFRDSRASLTKIALISAVRRPEFFELALMGKWGRSLVLPILNCLMDFSDERIVFSVSDTFGTSIGA